MPSPISDACIRQMGLPARPVCLTNRRPTGKFRPTLRGLQRNAARADRPRSVAQGGLHIRPAFSLSGGVRFDSQPVAHSHARLLFASEITLSEGLTGCVEFDQEPSAAALWVTVLGDWSSVVAKALPITGSKGANRQASQSTKEQ